MELPGGSDIKEKDSLVLKKETKFINGTDDVNYGF